MPDVPAVDIAELADQRAAGATLIDVRRDEELAVAGIPGAVHIPLDEVVERIDEVPTAGTVYVICASGGRSARAVEHFRSVGIDAVNVAGGIRAWIEAGLPTESSPGSGASSS